MKELSSKEIELHSQASRAHVLIVLYVEFKRNVLMTLMRDVDKKGTKHPLVPKIERQTGSRYA